RSLAEVLQHQRYPFARIYRDFWTEHPERRHPARYPLFDFAVTENPEVSAPSTECIPYERSSAPPGQDMVLTHELRAQGGMSLHWHVNAAVYTRQTAETWLEALTGWAAWLAEDRGRAGTPLPALLPREAALVEGWERGATVARPALRFHE